MGYQALLFCPDEKTARTVTQVLNELEFNVEACTEPFAAVKKLMGQHFDAVVVDCDNEQNATLLFKSARNSSSNQTSLAVAVVEGQAGVAKAFRIGANLVLTKPINIEQAKGTLRVARGLLRKSEPAKATSPATTPAAPAQPAPPKPAPLKPISAARPAAPSSLPPVPQRAVEIPVEKPVSTSPWPAAAAASSSPVEQDDVLEISVDESPAKSVSAAAAAPSLDVAASLPQAEKLPMPPTPAVAKPAFPAGSPVATGGAASAPAPARKIEEVPVPEKLQQNTTSQALLEKPAESAPSASTGFVGSAPSFTFGGANVEPESKGGSKKILIGAVAAVVLAAAGYFGWTHFQGHATAPTTTQVATPPSTATPPGPKPTEAKPSPAASASTTSAPAPNLPSATESSKNPATDDTDSTPKEGTLHATPSSTKPSNSVSPAQTKTVVEEPPAQAPLVVKGGKEPSVRTKPAAADAPAPSVIGMATPGAGAPPPNFVPTGDNSFKPMLQTLNISQGVSTGLLIKKVAPSYPSNALRMRIEGTVQLLATISKDGDITHIKVLSGETQLTKAAADAVKQWKYKPYLLNGEPVEIQTQITVNFKLPK